MPFVFVLLSALLLPAPALAVYRCEHQGKITYTDFRCDGDASPAALPEPPPPAAEPPREQALKRERAELTRLQRLREQRERQDQQLRDLAARGAAARDRKCRSLALQRSWREEDLREATLDKADTARKRLRRANEKYDAECR